MMTMQVRRLLAAAIVTGLLSLTAAAPLAGVSDHAGSQEARGRLEDAVRLRAAAGFRSDREFVQTTLDDVIGYPDMESGVPLSVAEAEDIDRRVAVQKELGRAREYQADLPESAGMYIDQPGGGIPVFLFTGSLDEHRAELARLLPPGLAYRVAPAERTLASLLWLKEEIWASRDALRRDGVTVTMAGVQRATNSVLVGVQALSEEKREKLHVRYGDAVTVRDEPAAETDCSGRFNCWPTKGGIEITSSYSLEHCTSGFIVKRTETNPDLLYMMTAGHCIEQNGGVGSTRFWSHNGNQMGYAGAETWQHNAIGDVGMIRLPNLATSHRQFLATEPSTIRDLLYIASVADAYEGLWICRMGRTWGKMCGYIYVEDTTRNVEGRDILHSYEVDFDGTGGDSGGPYFIGHEGYGIHTHSQPDAPGAHGWFSHVYYQKKAMETLGWTIHYCLTTPCI